jgi:hypothetical protein
MATDNSALDAPRTCLPEFPQPDEPPQPDYRPRRSLPLRGRIIGAHRRPENHNMRLRIDSPRSGSRDAANPLGAYLGEGDLVRAGGDGHGSH